MTSTLGTSRLGTSTLRTRALQAALVLTLAGPMPLVVSTVAQAQTAETPDARMKRIEAELRAVQRKVFPDGAGKTFAPDNRGHGQIHDQVPEAARNSAIFAITLESAGGVSAPTGAIYLRGEL